jgi:putative peptidoglycan lipid II flippase
MSNTKINGPDSRKSMLKSGGIVSLGVLSSRALGFVRDVVIAQFLGTGFMAEAFFVAQRIPNLFRELVGEGAANAAIVPVLAEYSQKKSRQEWLDVINAVMAWGIIILGGMTIVGMVAAPWVVKLMAPGFASDEAKFELTVALTRIMFPYLILIALTAFQIGILYSLNSFFVPAFGPCLLNIAMILSAWLAALYSWNLAYALSAGVLIGGIWQFIAQWLALRKQGVGIGAAKSLDHPGVRQIGRLLVPRLWGAGVYQLNVFVDTFCASLTAIVGGGGIAAIYYANRIVLFPLGVFGYALSSVALPSLSKMANDGRMDEFKSTLSFAVRKLMLILVPCSLVMIFGSHWIIKLIFQRGSFDSYSTDITAQTLMFFAIGLPFYGASRILVSGFYALQDTKTPVKAATVCLIINAVLNVILMFPLKIGGIALASSIASMANVWILWSNLKTRLKHSP